MPCVDVSQDVVVVAGGVVLHEARRIERFGEADHLRDLLLCLGEVFAAFFAAFHPIREEPPRLVVNDPTEDTWVVHIAFDHSAHGEFGRGEHLLRGLPPRVRHVRHDKQTELVRPVELTRDFDFDVDAVTRKRELL